MVKIILKINVNNLAIVSFRLNNKSNKQNGKL